ncbi:hypothetical protein [Streptomyces sp. NPDC006270]|uniref:hypothetical protein n=1 Tax=Streptomyces sp. NPDC006270 TaxID=3364741 RepID=UPI0036A9E7C3
MIRGTRPRPAPRRRRPGPGRSPAPTGTGRVSRLTQLADPKAQGLLTDEEFATERARVPRS